MARPHVVVVGLMALGLVAAVRTDAKSTRTVDVDTSILRDKPARVRGPAKLDFKNLNPLRYEIRIGTAVKISDEIVLGLPGLIPDLPSAVAPGAADPAETPGFMAEMRDAEEPALRALDLKSVKSATSAASRVRALQQILHVAVTQLLTYRASATEAAAALNDQGNALGFLLARSDDVLRTPGGDGHLAEQVAKLVCDITTALGNARWPDAKNLGRSKAAIAGVVEQLESLPKTAPDFVAWYSQTTHSDSYKELVEKAKQALVTVDALLPGGDAEKQFATTQSHLRRWAGLLSGFKSAAAFSATTEVKCGVPFLSEREFTYELVKRDRTAADPAKSEKHEPLVTVECLPAVSLSGGVAVSGHNVQDFEFTTFSDGAGGSYNGFGVTNRGGHNVRAIALLNTRLGTFTNEGAWALHLSAGTVLDGGTTGTQLGYVFGPSISVNDHLWLTGGVEYLKLPRLAGGFSEGDPVPEDVATPPVESSWRQSWFLAVTFKLK